MLSFNFRGRWGKKTNKHHDMAHSSVWAFTNGWENEFCWNFPFLPKQENWGLKKNVISELTKIQS